MIEMRRNVAISIWTFVLCLLLGFTNGDSSGASASDKAAVSNRVSSSSVDQTADGSSPGVCNTCLILFKDLHDWLASNVTRDEIENLLMTELCRRLRVDIFVKECNSIVMMYMPRLMQILVDQCDPNAICERLKCCQNDVVLGKASVGPACTAYNVGNGLCSGMMKYLKHEVRVKDFIDSSLCTRFGFASVKSACSQSADRAESVFIRHIIEKLESSGRCDRKSSTHRHVFKPFTCKESSGRCDRKSSTHRHVLQHVFKPSQSVLFDRCNKCLKAAWKLSAKARRLQGAAPTDATWLSRMLCHGADSSSCGQLVSVRGVQIMSQLSAGRSALSVCTSLAMCATGQ